jgi:hypothetical protein
VGFLRRLLGGGEPDDKAPDAAPAGPPGSAATVSPEVDEAARELDLLRADQARLNDELLQRQLRYADRSWTPPAQGGTRRSDDEGAPED